MKSLSFLLVIILLLGSCQKLEPRKPVSRRSGSTIDHSIKRNLALIEAEEKQIKEYIKRDSAHTYIESNSGFWYRYIVKDSLQQGATAMVGDLATYNYNLKSINGRLLVSKQEIGNRITKIDQSDQELISGIRDGLKIMKEGETALFLFPSYKGYGYYGLDNKIPSNTILLSEVQLLKVKKPIDN